MSADAVGPDLLQRHLRRDRRQRHRLLPDRHRPQRALRLHRPAQLRPGRLRRHRRLRRGRADRPVRLVAVGGDPAHLRRRDRARPDPRRPDAAPARRLPGHRHDRDGRDHPPVPQLRALPLAVRRHRRPAGLHRPAAGPQPVLRPLHGVGPVVRRLRPVHDHHRLDPRRARRRCSCGR